MKSAITYELPTMRSKWETRSLRVEPCPEDFGFNTDADETLRALERDRALISELTSRMRRNPSRVEYPERRISPCTDLFGCGARGRVRLHIWDLGRCIVGDIELNERMKSVQVIFPASRKDYSEHTLWERLGALLPDAVRDRVIHAIQQRGLDHPDNIVFNVMLGTRVGPSAPMIARYQRGLWRAALRWPELKGSKTVAEPSVLAIPAPYQWMGLSVH